MSSLLLLIVLVLFATSLTFAAQENCTVATNIGMVFGVSSPDQVDIVVHPFCARHGVLEVDMCNLLREYYLQFCFPDYYATLIGPVYLVQYNNQYYNIQERNQEAMRESSADADTVSVIDANSVGVNKNSQEEVSGIGGAGLEFAIDRFCDMLPDMTAENCDNIKRALLPTSADLNAAPIAVAALTDAHQLLRSLHEEAVISPSDINQHLEDIFHLAQGCNSVLEIGTRGMASTFAFLWGFVQSIEEIMKNGNFSGQSTRQQPTQRKRHIGIDLLYPPGHVWQNYQRVCVQYDFNCNFIPQNDMKLTPPQWDIIEGVDTNSGSADAGAGAEADDDVGAGVSTEAPSVDARIGAVTSSSAIMSVGVDILFIDALHTYCHVLFELDTFSSYAHKYIMLHDTAAPWGREDEPYSGEIDHSSYSYPVHYDRSKQGVRTAVEDFLARVENQGVWVVKLDKTNNSGFMVLERVARVDGK